MPITPFHFGPGAAFHALAPGKISFIAFCAANVLIDVEPLYYMLTAQYPLHRFFHTVPGALLIAALTIGFLCIALKLGKRLRLPNVFTWRELSLSAMTGGAMLGTLSHVVFDSVMHSDMHPLFPFSEANPLLGLVSLETLHLGCALAGALGLAAIMLRKYFLRKLG